MRFSYFRLGLPRATQTHRLTNYEWLKRKRPRNASRAATQIIFRVRRIADCQVLASRNARLKLRRAKLAAASLNRSRLALMTIEIDPQVVLVIDPIDPGVVARRADRRVRQLPEIDYARLVVATALEDREMLLILPTLP